MVREYQTNKPNANVQYDQVAGAARKDLKGKASTKREAFFSDLNKWHQCTK